MLQNKLHVFVARFTEALVKLTRGVNEAWEGAVNTNWSPYSKMTLTHYDLYTK